MREGDMYPTASRTILSTSSLGRGWPDSSNRERPREVGTKQMEGGEAESGDIDAGYHGGRDLVATLIARTSDATQYIRCALFRGTEDDVTSP